MHLMSLSLDLLEGNEEGRIEVLKKNTHYFLQGHKAHNVLIWGPRGGGKSSLVRGLIGRYAEEGLRAIEIVPERLFVFAGGIRNCPGSTREIYRGVG